MGGVLVLLIVPKEVKNKTQRKRQMKIAICDDSIKDIRNIEGLLAEYQESCPGLEFEIEKYMDSTKLKQKIQQKDFAEIYILDIIMSETTGIDLGSQIREEAGKSIIIYITSSDDFALDAYEVHAARYLLKPIEREKFFEALEYAFSCTEVKRRPMYLVKTRDGLVSVPYSKIEYIENSSRTLEVNLTEGKQIRSIFMRKSFEEEIGQLAEEREFIQVHKSFLINMGYIKRLDGSSVIMDSGVRIPVSRKNVANVKRQYLMFAAEQY